MKGYVVVVGRRRFVEKSEVERGRESIARSVVYSPQPNSPFVFDSSHGPSALHHYRGLKQQLIHLIGLPRIVTTSFSCSIYRYPADVVLRKGSQDVCFKHTPYGNSNPHSLHKSQESRVKSLDSFQTVNQAPSSMEAKEKSDSASKTLPRPFSTPASKSVTLASFTVHREVYGFAHDAARR